MTPDTQSMIGVPLPTIAVLVGILVNNSRLSDFRSSNDRRVEEVVDARLKHLEERER